MKGGGKMSRFLNVKTVDPTECADLLFGVGSATSAGPTLPAGSIHPSPETLKKDCGGYLREQPIIGFGHAYTSGAGGTKCYGNFLLSPTVDRIELDHAKRASFAKSGTERASCYQYEVELENGIRAKVTPAHNAAIYSFEYPNDKDAFLLIDAAHKLDIDDVCYNSLQKRLKIKKDNIMKIDLKGATPIGNIFVGY